MPKQKSEFAKERCIMGLFTKKKSTDDYAEEGNKLFDEENYSKAIQIWLGSCKKTF